MKTTSCTEQKHYAFDNAPRCGAKTKRNQGNPCRSPAVHGKQRCRLHGGSVGSGAKYNNKNALKHGSTTKEAKAHRRTIRSELKFWKNFQELYD
jgi:hypothetical protein